MEPLTGRERVNRAFERADQDRIPRHESFWSETITRWQHEGLQGGEAAVLERLGTDFQGLCWSWPAPFPGQSVVVQEDDRTQVIRDAHGATARFWKGRSGTPEHLGFECNSVDAWHARFKPALLSTGVQVDVVAAERQFAYGRSRARWCFLSGVETFEATRKLLGDDTALIAMATDPEWIVDVSRTNTDLLLRDFEAVIASGIQPDGLWLYGDMAYNHATMCSPAMYRELIWPDHKRIADWAHARGMKLIFHTDGDVNGVIPLYVEAGFDCLQPLEVKANMDVRRLCPRYGDSLAFFGNIDVMILGSNDRERIEAEISSKLAAGKATRGYMYHSDHSVPPLVSWDTYQFVMECVDRYGAYQS